MIQQQPAGIQAEENKKKAALNEAMLIWKCCIYVFSKQISREDKIINFLSQAHYPSTKMRHFCFTCQFLKFRVRIKSEVLE